MSKVTIIADDGKVGVDGVFRQVSLAGLDPDIHAVQWDGTAGEIEYRRGTNKANEIITQFNQFAAFETRWFAAEPPAPPPPLTRGDRIDGQYSTDAFQGLLAEIASLKGVTVQQLVASIKLGLGA